jgi:hypothetical protein
MHPDLEKVIFLPQDVLKRMIKVDILHVLFRICDLERLKLEITTKYIENCDKCSIWQALDQDGHDEVDGKMEIDYVGNQSPLFCSHFRPDLFTIFDSYGLSCMEEIYKTPRIKIEIYEQLKKEINNIREFCTVEISENDVFHYYFELNAVGGISNFNDSGIKKLMIILWK